MASMAFGKIALPFFFFFFQNGNKDKTCGGLNDGAAVPENQDYFVLFALSLCL